MNQSNNYYALQVSRSKMSLLALLFFMMGSVDLYGRIRRSSHVESRQSKGEVAPLLKLAALGAIAAAALEIGHLAHLVG
ncbi:MAG: hypothetical protein AB4041_12945 [Microcystaceae cyanobacterium]